MARRRKKRKNKTKVKLFNFGGSGKKRAKTSRQPLNLRYAFWILTLAAVFACIWFGFLFLDKYVKTTVGFEEKQGSLYLVDVPLWVNEPLKEKIYNAARADGEDLKLDADAAWSIQQNIKDLVAWLEEVKVQTTSDRFLIKAKWRKPLALIKYGLHKYYVDANLVLLDFVPALNLPIVKVTGLEFKTKPPYAGEIWQLEDLAAAVRILTKLEQMDKALTPDKPLLNEIERIDVDNFDGRKNSGFAHIILYTADNTEIIWGAEFGAWQRNLEAPDEEKLAKLYSYYKEHGTLLNGAKYINLRNPQDNIFQPIDKY